MSLSKPYVFNRTDNGNDDPVKAVKMGKRFNEAMTLALNPEPSPVDPRLIGINPVNRLFSVMQCHNVILKGIIKDGHDPTRPAPGILAEVNDPKEITARVTTMRNLAHRPSCRLAPRPPPL